MTWMRLGRGPMLVLGHVVLVQTIATAMRPTLSYGVLDLGGSPAVLGAVSAAFALPGVFLALPAGHALDRLGERSLLILGPTSVVAAALLVTFVGSSIAVLVLATALLGFGHLLSLIGQQAMLANTTPSGRFDSIFGIYTFGASLGQTLGPTLLLLPGGTVRTPPLTLIFATCAGLGVVLFGLSMLMRSSAHRRSPSAPGMMGTASALLRTPGLRRSLIATSIVLSSADIFIAYAPALGHDRGLSTAVISAMLVARSGMSMFSRLFLGPMVRALGRRRLLIWTIALSAVSLACVALPLPGIWLVVLSGVYGFVIGSCQPITMSWVSDLSPPGTRGLAMSMRLTSNRIGQTVLPTTMGTFAAATGAAGVLVGTAVLLVGAAWSSSAVPEATADDDGSSPSTDLE
jgi:MFS family permease